MTKNEIHRKSVDGEWSTTNLDFEAKVISKFSKDPDYVQIGHNNLDGLHRVSIVDLRTMEILTSFDEIDYVDKQLNISSDGEAVFIYGDGVYRVYLNTHFKDEEAIE